MLTVYLFNYILASGKQKAKHQKLLTANYLSIFFGYLFTLFNSLLLRLQVSVYKVPKRTQNSRIIISYFTDYCIFYIVIAINNVTFTISFCSKSLKGNCSTAHKILHALSLFFHRSLMAKWLEQASQ